MKASDLLVRCLESEGVQYVFGIPGEEVEDLLFSLQKSSIRFIPTRHEQGAAFMADVWGRLSGKAGVCLATLGPGATNLLTGVADANLDKSPVVAITGQGALQRLHKESHQYLDLVGLFRGVTKWNAGLTDPASIPEVVRKAFKVAQTEKPGAAHIQLPEDVAALKTAPARPIPDVPVRRPDPDDEALRAAAALLRKSRHPLILAGNGTVRKPVSEELTAFVDRHRIPVAATFMGKGAVSDRNPASLLAIGMGLRDFVMEALERADVVIAAGYDLAEYPPERWNPKKDKKIIHVDFVPADVYAHYQPSVEIVADIAATFRELGRLFGRTGIVFDDAWFAPVRRRILADIQGYGLKKGRRFTIPGVLNVLRSVMGDDDLLISDVGSHKIWIARNFPVYRPNRCLISNGLASMGFALPGAVAAALHDPDRRIVAAMGDGGFLMNSQELETAKRLRLGFTTVIFNDNDYGLISWKQRMETGHATGTRITNPDFKRYAESFGIRSYRPRHPDELRRQLERALGSRELCVIDIPVDAGVNLQLSAKLKKSRTTGRR